MGLYLCNTCGSTLIKSGEHEPLSAIYETEIPFRNSEKCPVCNIVANLMYYPNASFFSIFNSITKTVKPPDLITERKLLYDQIAQLNSSFADFRAEVRGALFPFWPNNPGVSDQEIIEAIQRCVKQIKKWQEKSYEDI